MPTEPKQPSEPQQDVKPDDPAEEPVAGSVAGDPSD